MTVPFSSRRYVCSKCKQEIARAPEPHGEYSNYFSHVPGWTPLCTGAVPEQIYPPIYKPRHALENVKCVHGEATAHFVEVTTSYCQDEYTVVTPCAGPMPLRVDHLIEKELH